MTNPLSQLPMFTPASVSAAAYPLATSTNLPARPRTLLILGEAPGADEVLSGKPFTGASGRLLREVLFPQAGLSIDEWNITNVFLTQPPDNLLIDNWTLTKTAWKKEFGNLPPSNPPPISKRYLHPDHYWHLSELRTRLESLRPDFVLCLGGTALWAITGQQGISNGRGTFFKTPWGTGIATYHPAAILREYSFLPIAWADCSKAREFLEGTIAPPVARRLWYNPTIEEIRHVYYNFRRVPEAPLGVDIETCPAIGQITTISFGTERESICIPFWDRDFRSNRSADNPPQPLDFANYWKTPADEVKAWKWVKRFCELPNLKVLQNGLYDMQYMLDAPIELRLAGQIEDTAIMSHAQQPELPKSLGMLASLNLNEPSWKNMRQQAKDAKADE